MAFIVAFSADLAFHSVLEFLKVTFFMGIPFIFLQGYMKKKNKYSWPWVLSGLLIFAVLGLYLNLLLNLPQRIEVRRIVSEGGSLVAEGKYDAAIEEYGRLGKLGRSQDMDKYVATALKEKQAAQDLSLAQQLFKEGKKQEALEILHSIPSGTRAFREADRLRKELGG